MILEFVIFLATAVGPVPKASLPTVPGSVNPAITQANMKETICAPKGTWSTSSIRPPTSYTNKLKRQQMAALGYTIANPIPTVKTASGTGLRPDRSKCVVRSANPACFEEDHIVPLVIGGHPTDPLNLFPQRWSGAWNAGDKDRLEVRLRVLVCAGTIGLREAQDAIATDWVAAYKRYVVVK